MKEPGFFRTLLDFNFEKYITRQIAGAAYATLVVLIALATVIIEIAVIAQLGNSYFASTGMFLIPLVPVTALVAVVILRLAFESGVALVAIAENTKNPKA